MTAHRTFDTGIGHDCTVKAGSSPFWLTDRQALARVRAAVSGLLEQSVVAVQDDVTVTESLEWLARNTCADVDLDPCLIPLVQALAAMAAAGIAHTGSADPLGLLDDARAGLTAFERRPESAQVKLLDRSIAESDFG